MAIGHRLLRSRSLRSVSARGASRARCASEHSTRALVPVTSEANPPCRKNNISNSRDTREVYDGSRQ